MAEGNRLIEFWKKCSLTGPLYFHEEDKSALQSYELESIRDFEQFTLDKRFGDSKDRRFHLSLLPIPYGGNLEQAEIIILLLNPGLGFTDYYGEMQVPEYKSRLERNLRQSFSDKEFPFIWLDPKFCWHGGFHWWEKKLRSVLTEIAKKEEYEGSYLNALRSLSKKLAFIELAPYHSNSFDEHGLLENLKSVEEAQKYVEEIIPKAKDGRITLIATRGISKWGLQNQTGNDTLVIYNKWEARAAGLGKETRGGKAILKSYGISS